MKKGPFNIEQHLLKIDARIDKMEAKQDAKCDKKLEWANKICGVAEKADCDKWASAQKVKCEVYGEARIANKEATAKCMAEYKHMIASFKNDELKPRDAMDNSRIGNCFSAALTAADAAYEAADGEYEEALDGVTDFTEEEMTAAKTLLRKQRKE